MSQDQITYSAAELNITTIHLPCVIENPIQRILLTSIGTLQQLLCAFYNFPIKVDILYNHITEESLPNQTVYQRRVNLTCNSKIVVIATSKMILKSSRAISILNNNNKIAIGQFYKIMKVFPDFQILDVSLNIDSSFSRKYILNSCDLECQITEEFVSGMLSPDFIFQ
ncbi:hypothetical protein BB561_003940 [Smittium simulii]|uniref:Uncharacterized protein n=1 Tax=Smittium simulii TaxID=133385 RepID=A0A2T9YIX1_9FUNG|nr:hypothetical protein BB561_003940 [Smittium simulii]